MATPVQRGTSGGSTTLPIPHGELVDIDFLNAGALVIARKATTLDVSNTTTETDLLNGEFTLPANLMGTKGMLRLTMWGDGHWGVSQNPPRFKAKLGSTVIIDTNSIGTGPAISGGSATRGGWRAIVEVQNLGATGAQLARIGVALAVPVGPASATQSSFFATGQGVYLAPLGTANGTIITAEGMNASAAVDTTADQSVLFTVINGSATSTDLKLIGAVMEIV